MSELVYADSAVVVVQKRAGEAVQGRRQDQKSLLRFWRQVLDAPELQPVHRIDQPVGGLVILARHTKAFNTVQRALTQGAVHRQYVAVLSTAPHPPEGTLEDRIQVEGGKNRSRVDPAGKRAVLHYRTVGHTDHHTVVEVTLDTGRHHQIRAQFGHRGWAVVGDTKYGARRPLKDRGIALLAFRVAFSHPEQPLTVSCQAQFPETSLWQAVATQVLPLAGEDEFPAR